MMDIKLALHRFIIAKAHAFNRGMILDMVGVVGSNPIAPTNTHPRKSLICEVFLFPQRLDCGVEPVPYGKSTEIDLCSD
jgi:hypothetical protein